MTIFAEYIWLDGSNGIPQLRSKTQVLETNEKNQFNPSKDLPDLIFDGSLTGQALPGKADLVLKPIHNVADPIKGKPHLLVLCEVFCADGTPHGSNQRAKLRDFLYGNGISVNQIHSPQFRFTQEYVLMDGDKVMGHSGRGLLGRTQNHYCKIDAGKKYGRNVAEDHLVVCANAGLFVNDLHSAYMPGSWSFSVGYHAQHGGDPLTASDQLWLARWLLRRVADEYDVENFFDYRPQIHPFKASLLTTFSISSMRQSEGIKAIMAFVKRLEQAHNDVFASYGLTNKAHQKIPEFTYGIGAVDTSIRIPVRVQEQGQGYLEDRRPSANADPYQVCIRMLETILEFEREHDDA